jgi:hypothetical protein
MGLEFEDTVASLRAEKTGESVSSKTAFPYAPFVSAKDFVSIH